MLRFVASMFGCAHRHLTFPRTTKKPGADSTMYVVCLDCAKKFTYDWELMKVVTSAKHKQREVA